LKAICPADSAGNAGRCWAVVSGGVRGGMRSEGFRVDEVKTEEVGVFLFCV
jgi:hypothetical protein